MIKESKESKPSYVYGQTLELRRKVEFNISLHVPNNMWEWDIYNRRSLMSFVFNRYMAEEVALVHK